MPAVADAADKPDYLIGTEAAPIARVVPSTVYRWIKDGLLPATKINNRWSCAARTWTRWWRVSRGEPRPEVPSRG